MVGEVITAVGALGGLLGGRRRTPSYNSFYGDQLKRYTQGLDELRSGYGQLRSQAEGGYSHYDPQYRAAVDDYAGYLRQDPFTGVRDQADLQQATEGASAAYARGRANLLADNALRGGGDSSLLSGGNAVLEAALAGARANAAQDLGYRRVEERDRRRQALLSLLGGARQTYAGSLADALAGQREIDQSAASLYGGLLGGGQRIDADMAKARGDQIVGLAAALGGLFPKKA